MRISKNSAFMYADITLKDLGECDVNKAVAEFESAPWQEQFAFSDKLTKEGEDSVLPDITFPIGDVHLTAQLAEDGVNFNVEGQLLVEFKPGGFYCRVRHSLV